ncbi:pyridoxine 5'-phosphate synthase [Campylobacterota bacterium]|nr:pyridoxine 5'-phosphate synthase [Campylobacterota bacterium]
MKLGVNIDHIAVLKAARRVGDPDTLQAVYVAAQNGADQITIHLREDRRHIDDYDAERIVQNSPIAVNMECALNESVLEIVAAFAPARVTLVPEKREEVTTEGGLDAANNGDRLKNAVAKLRDRSVAVSLFIEPSEAQIDAAQEAGADMVEFHTGRYANLWAMLNGNLARTPYAPAEFAALDRRALLEALKAETKRLRAAAVVAHEAGLSVAAGHGLNYHNVGAIAKMAHIEELNIGQSIVARSVWVGLAQAVGEMRELLR